MTTSVRSVAGAALGLGLSLGLSLLSVGCGPSESGAPAAQAPAGLVDSFAFTPAAQQSLAGGSSETPRIGGTMTLAASAEYATLNNITRTSGASESFCRNYLFPPLLDLDPDTLELKPLLAESRQTLAADQRTYTWKLRSGVFWDKGRADGTPVEVTTADVDFSWKMAKDPAVLCEAAKSTLEPFELLEIVDATTFRVRTRGKFFRAELEFGYSFRLMPAHLATHDPGAFAKDPLGSAPIGYGPYRFREWKAGEFIALDRNPDWFAQATLPYYPEQFIVRFVPDLAALPRLFDAGEILYTVVNDVTQYEQMKRDPAVQARATFHEYFVPTLNYIVWSERHPAFADARVRTAMTLLYPRAQVKEKVYLGHAAVISGPWAISANEYDKSVAPLPTDPARARELLAQAGWTDHDGDGLLDKEGQPFRFTLKHASTAPPAFITGNLWFQENLRALGIEMSTLPVEPRQLFAEQAERRFDAIEVGWTPDPRDDDLFDRFSSAAAKEGRNYSGYSDPECDALLEAYRGEFDDARRLEIAHALHRKLADEAPHTPLYSPQPLLLVSTKLRGVKVHRLGARWYGWWIAP